MAAPDIIQKLCATFAAHREHYTSTGYNETELRREFLDPFICLAMPQADATMPSWGSAIPGTPSPSLAIFANGSGLCRLSRV